MKNLVYISGSTFPSTAANSIQVIKMCEEFSKYYNVTLFAKVNSNLVFSEDDVFDYYDCKKTFKIVLISSISNIHYSLKIFFSQILIKETILYSRNLFPVILLSIFFKKNIFFEAHIDPKNQPIYNRIFKFFIKHLNINFIAISAELRRIYSKYYNIKEEKILISHDAADHNKFKMKKKTN